MNICIPAANKRVRTASVRRVLSQILAVENTTAHQYGTRTRAIRSSNCVGGSAASRTKREQEKATIDCSGDHDVMARQVRPWSTKPGNVRALASAKKRGGNDQRNSSGTADQPQLKSEWTVGIYRQRERPCTDVHRQIQRQPKEVKLERRNLRHSPLARSSPTGVLPVLKKASTNSTIPKLVDEAGKFGKARAHESFRIFIGVLPRLLMLGVLGAAMFGRYSNVD
jgi:hypothetical protein